MDAQPVQEERGCLSTEAILQASGSPIRGGMPGSDAAEQESDKARRWFMNLCLAKPC